MCWCSPVEAKGTREAEIVNSNPGNGGKNRTRAYSRKKYLSGYPRIFFIFIPTRNIYFNIQNNDARHLCVKIGDGLRLP